MITLVNWNTVTVNNTQWFSGVSYRFVFTSAHYLLPLKKPNLLEVVIKNNLRSSAHGSLFIAQAFIIHPSEEINSSKCTIGDHKKSMHAELYMKLNILIEHQLIKNRIKVRICVYRVCGFAVAFNYLILNYLRLIYAHFDAHFDVTFDHNLLFLVLGCIIMYHYHHFTAWITSNSCCNNLYHCSDTDCWFIATL